MRASDTIWIDARAALDPDQGLRGIGRYVNEHARALVRRHGARITAVLADTGVALPERLSWMSRAAQIRDLRAIGAPPPALYHLMSPFEPLWPLEVAWPRAARGPHTRLAVTVYDLIPKALDAYRLRGSLHTRYEARLGLISRADHVLAISQVTAEDVQRYAGVADDRITVIDAGVTRALPTGLSSAGAQTRLQARFPGLQPGFPLYVGGADPRKNLERLVEAWGLVDPATRHGRALVVCGHAPPDRVQALTRAAANSGLGEGDVLQTGYVTDDELAALYRMCGIFVFPSSYEGFGLPILEAMAFGVPVVAAAASTTPEILGDLDGTFQPDDPHEMARVLSVALTDDALRARLTERSRRRIQRFTWERVADRTLDSYERALARPPRRARRRRPRVLWSAPPASDIVAQLALAAEVDVVTPPRPVPGTREIASVTAARAADALRTYDHRLHTAGTPDVERFARLLPGHVWVDAVGTDVTGLTEVAAGFVAPSDAVAAAIAGHVGGERITVVDSAAELLEALR